MDEVYNEHALFQSKHRNRQYNKLLRIWNSEQVLFAEAIDSDPELGVLYQGRNFGEVKFTEIPEDCIVLDRMAKRSGPASSFVVATRKIDVKRSKIERRFLRLLRQANNFKRKSVGHQGFCSYLGQKKPQSSSWFVPRTNASIRLCNGKRDRRYMRRWKEFVVHNYFPYGKMVSEKFSPLFRLCQPSFVSGTPMQDNSLVESGIACMDFACPTHVDRLDGRGFGAAVGGITLCGAAKCSDNFVTDSCFYLPSYRKFICMDQNISWLWFAGELAHGTSSSLKDRLPITSPDKPWCLDYGIIGKDDFDVSKYTITWGGWYKQRQLWYNLRSGKKRKVLL